MSSTKHKNDNPQLTRRAALTKLPDALSSQWKIYCKGTVPGRFREGW
ncbi:MAG TPA: hypothetical protein VK728_17035 [Candidatus Sulfotelmatobacter sp.]|nr:hypothetical protein [Candidatus Sulfotelmatobacter sp.]